MLIQKNGPVVTSTTISIINYPFPETTANVPIVQHSYSSQIVAGVSTTIGQSTITQNSNYETKSKPVGSIKTSQISNMATFNQRITNYNMPSYTVITNQTTMGVCRGGQEGPLPPLACQNSMFFDFF